MALESTDDVESEGAIECGFREAKGILDAVRGLWKKNIIDRVEAGLFNPVTLAEAHMVADDQRDNHKSTFSFKHILKA